MLDILLIILLVLGYAIFVSSIFIICVAYVTKDMTLDEVEEFWKNLNNNITNWKDHD